MNFSAHIRMLHFLLGLAKEMYIMSLFKCTGVDSFAFRYIVELIYIYRCVKLYAGHFTIHNLAYFVNLSRVGSCSVARMLVLEACCIFINFLFVSITVREARGILALEHEKANRHGLYT